MSARRGATQSSCMVTVKTTAGNARPVAWEAGVRFWPDEPVADVLAKLDTALAQVRAQAQQDIQEVCR